MQRKDMFHYAAFGLVLACEQSIPGFIRLPGGSVADLQIVLGRLPRWAAQADVAKQAPSYISPFQNPDGIPLQKVWEFASSRFLLRYCDGVIFAVDHSVGTIWGKWAEDLSLDHAALYLRGSVMSLVLGLRGFVCLHASAALIDGRAAVFVGPPGAGKSTTALGLARRGFAALTDDIVAISAKGNGFSIQPGHSRLGLWPAPEVVGTWVEELPRIIADEDKRSFDLEARSGAYHASPCELGVIYLLDPRPSGTCPLGIEELATKEGLVKLLANNYGSGRLSRECRAREFEVLGKITSLVPVRRLRVPRDPGGLDRLCDLILRDSRERNG
jgi:hypothetical protein